MTCSRPPRGHLFGFKIVDLLSHSSHIIHLYFKADDVNMLAKMMPNTTSADSKQYQHSFKEHQVNYSLSFKLLFGLHHLLRQLSERLSDNPLLSPASQLLKAGGSLSLLVCFTENICLQMTYEIHARNQAEPCSNIASCWIITNSL